MKAEPEAGTRERARARAETDRQTRLAPSRAAPPAGCPVGLPCRLPLSLRHRRLLGSPDETRTGARYGDGCDVLRGTAPRGRRFGTGGRLVQWGLVQQETSRKTNPPPSSPKGPLLQGVLLPSSLHLTGLRRRNMRISLREVQASSEPACQIAPSAHAALLFRSNYIDILHSCRGDVSDCSFGVSSLLRSPFVLDRMAAGGCLHGRDRYGRDRYGRHGHRRNRPGRLKAP